MPFGKCEFHGPSFLKSIGISQREPPKRPQLEQIFPRYNKAVQVSSLMLYEFVLVVSLESDNSVIQLLVMSNSAVFRQTLRAR